MAPVVHRIGETSASQLAVLISCSRYTGHDFSPASGPCLIDENLPVRDEDDAAGEDAEFAFVRGRGECIKGDVDYRGLSRTRRQIERGWPSIVGEYLVCETPLPKVGPLVVTELEESSEVRKRHGSASIGSINP